MTRATRVRALLALALLALSAFLAVTQPVRLGLDLRGGTQIVLETRDSPTADADRDATDRTLEVLRRRVDALGVAEPSIARSGDHRIVVELPGVQDPEQATEVLGRTAQLTVHPVLGTAPGPQQQDRKEKKTADPAEKVLPDASGAHLRLGPPALTGAEVDRADAQFDAETGAGWFVGLDLRGTGERAWAGLTGEAACAPPGDPARRAAIVLDDKVISSPQVDTSVACGTGITGGSTRITGGFDQEAAAELALLVNGGALPVPVEVVEQRTVGPTLGAAAIDSSARAAALGIALTAVFLTVVYRLLGFLATLALACYALLSYAALLAVGATLTLPGLAGFVLAVGMAVDANVLVFERAREEYAAGGSGRATRSDGSAAAPRSLRTALTAGFRHAFSAIADSNVTTLLAAGLLFLFASGPVRGFGVTLSVGVLASMVSALLVTRVLAEYAVTRKALERRPRLSGIAGHGRVRRLLVRRGPSLMRHRRRWLAGSAAALILATSGIALRGLDFGVEFTGGRQIAYTTESPVDAERARTALGDAGFPRAVVQTSGDGELTVRTERLTGQQEDRVGEVVDALGGGAQKVRDELIGPSLGDELRRNALIALGVALAGQMAYLALRFRWTFAVSAVAAMAHDVLILVGVFAWLGKPVDGVFLAALLTVIGYSVNDSVVVFDRVRELWAAARRTPFPQIADTALLQTVPRTVNTGIGAVFILAALAVLGGDSLTDFAVALLIGIGVGTYSSMFTATPLAIALEARSGSPAPRPAGRRSGGRRAAGTRRGPGQRPGNGAQV
ncbi:protein translocase subunit SecD [Streptomyces pinistramenti]|uniref:protein translocase subunit SecD n=1 Tax=Streptomyces pinistramenti TaxID=2884812 RepID=UPI001D09423C|nr:protein translocase subunit SecD [Streptomyces pinistramenti]MCB5911101.1 protein translocase subunit SecD [Streptomyces pinistramenti]